MATAGSGWVVAVSEGNRAKGSLVPIAQVAAGHQDGSKAVVGLTDGSVLFVENIPNHELANYVSGPLLRYPQLRLLVPLPLVLETMLGLWLSGTALTGSGAAC